MYVENVVNIPIQTPMTVIAQDDHLPAGAWAACVLVSNLNYVKDLFPY